MDIEVQDAPLTESELQKFRSLAAQVKDDRHFSAILNTVPYSRRKELYGIIKPHLSFRPKPFVLYKFF